MKKNPVTLAIFSIIALASLALAACGPAVTPTPVVTEPPATEVPTEALIAGPVTLTIRGLVDTELQLTDTDLHDMDVVTLTLEHPKNGPTEYTGVRLNDLLNEAGVQVGAVTITLTASDGYSNDLELATVQACTDCLVAFDAETAGVYNAAMAGQSGKSWVKQLITIEVK